MVKTGGKMPKSTTMAKRVLCVISDKFQFIVLLLPKNASSTIRKQLKKDLFAGHEQSYYNLLPEQLDYYKAVFLRDPIDRFLSGYHEVYCRHIGQGQYFKRHGIDKERTLHFLNPKDDVDSMYEFLDHIENRGFFNVHIYRQVDIIGEVPVDFYFSVEQLQRDFQQLYHLIGAAQSQEPLPFLRKRRVRKDRRNFIYNREELPEDLIQQIKKIYAEDIELYRGKVRRP